VTPLLEVLEGEKRALRFPHPRGSNYGQQPRLVCARQRGDNILSPSEARRIFNEAKDKTSEAKEFIGKMLVQ